MIRAKSLKTLYMSRLWVIMISISIWIKIYLLANNNFVNLIDN